MTISTSNFRRRRRNSPFLTLLLLFIIPDKVVSFCPNHCHCDDVGLRVRCVNASLDVVPILLNPLTRWLDLSRNNILALLPGFAFFPDLEYLDLSDNEISTLGKKNFVHQSQLENLIVRSNKLSHIQEKSLDGLKYLRQMDLSDNTINVIDDSSFIFLESLIYLDLSSNRLSNMTKDMFFNLSSLKFLNLCNNDIDSLVPGVFDHLVQLEELHICSNILTSISDFAFNTLGNLVHLSLYGNDIGYFSTNALVGLTNLRILDIHDNSLKEIPTTSFMNLQNIEELHLGENHLEIIPSNSFIGISSLKELLVTKCIYLTLIEPNAFKNLGNLSKLELSFNKELLDIPNDILKPLLSLRHLSLKGNNLQTLDRNLFRWLSLEYMDLRDNNFECNCSLKWLQELELNKTSSLKLEGIYCSSPEWTAGRNIIELSDYDLKCYSQLILVAVCVAGIVVFFLSVIIAGFIYYKHCRKMKTLVHDNWPEKIVATWRDPEYEKQLEDEEYTFQSARSVSHIHIPVI